MKLKSLLLSSAAAIVATGSASAQAADVIVEAEPEPVEYVRVCDAYGAGFFFIPGSETCLRFEGYAQYIISATEDELVNSSRFRLNIDARSDTDWGTLRGFGRLQADNNDNTDASPAVDQGIIQLGGFHAGYTESAFVSPWEGLGIASFGILHTDGGGSYGYQQRNQIGYTWHGAGGFSVTVALEDDNHTAAGTAIETAQRALTAARTALGNPFDARRPGPADDLAATGAYKTLADAQAALGRASTALNNASTAAERATAQAAVENAEAARDNAYIAVGSRPIADSNPQDDIDDAVPATGAHGTVAAARTALDDARADVDNGDGFVPDITGVIGFSQAWGGLWAKGGYDESANAGTVMAGIQINVPDAPNSSFKAGVFYATDPNAYAPHAPLGGIVLPAGVDGIDTEWSVAASYRHEFNPAFRAMLGGQYFEDFAGDNSYLIQGALTWIPVPDQFEIWLESAYEDNDAAEDGAWSGFLRFRRFF